MRYFVSYKYLTISFIIKVNDFVLGSVDLESMLYLVAIDDF